MKYKKLITFLWIIVILLVVAKVTLVLLLQSALPQALRKACSRQGITLHSIHVHPDWFGSGLEISDIEASRSTKKAFRFRLSRLEASGIHILTLLLRDRLVARHILLDKAELRCTAPLRRKSGPLILPCPVEIGSLSLRHVNILVHDTVGHRLVELQNASCILHDLQYQANEEVTGRVADRMSFTSSAIAMQADDSMYTYEASGVAYISGRHLLTARSFRVKPSYTRYDFTSRRHIQTDCITAEFDNISFSGIPAGLCLTEGSMRSHHVSVGKMSLDIFRDRSQPDRPEPMPMIQQALYDYPQVLQFDSVNIHDGDITYSEHVKETNHVASVRLRNVNAFLSGITNDTLAPPGDLFLRSEANILGAHLRCQVRGKRFDPSQTLYLHGSLGKINALAFNEMLESSSPVRITSGVLDEMKFDFRANSSRSDGRMELLYHDLDIKLNKGAIMEIPLLQPFLFFLVTGRIYDSNPDKDKPARIGIIECTRYKDRSIFNYCLQSLLAGSQSVMSKRMHKKAIRSTKSELSPHEQPSKSQNAKS